MNCPADPAQPARLMAWAHGHVQGVGFRWAVRSAALARNLTGFAKNYPDGRVLVVAEGDPVACRSLLGWLRGAGAPDDAPPGRVDLVVEQWADAHGGYDGFARR